MLSLAFRKRVPRVMEALSLTHSQVWTTQTVVVDKMENVVAREVEFSPWFRKVCDSPRTGAVRFFNGVTSACSTSMKRDLKSSEVGI